MLINMKRRGFSIVELAIVITIIGILLVLGVVNLNDAQVNARDAERKHDIEAIASHLETFYTSGSTTIATYGKYPSLNSVNGLIGNESSYFLDYDSESLKAPDNSTSSLIAATNNIQTTAGVLPQPTINQYVYQPIADDGGLCGNTQLKALVVAGGGGGGGNHGGGGGGGGVIYNDNLSINTGTYSVVVGNGGNGGIGSVTLNSVGNSGENSSFYNLTAIGGGGGGSRLTTGSVYQAKVGGSGGGGAGTIDSLTGLPGAGKSGTAGQGFAGGNGTSNAVAGNGGGGGGAGAIGGNATGTGGSGVGTSGSGGNGLSYDISGIARYYGGGGSGGLWGTNQANIGVAGLGGGGLGGYDYVAGRPGALSYFGGGGGGGGGGAPGGGDGNPGIVIIAYKSGSISATGGVISNANGYTIHTFTKNGTFEILNNKINCRKYNLYYRTESDNVIHMIKSKNQ